jgi:hypothetical protein
MGMYRALFADAKMATGEIATPNSHISVFFHGSIINRSGIFPWFFFTEVLAARVAVAWPGTRNINEW